MTNINGDSSKDGEAPLVIVDPTGDDPDTSTSTNIDDNVESRNEQELSGTTTEITGEERDNLRPQSEPLRFPHAAIEAIDHVADAFRSLQESQTGRVVSKLIGNLFVVATSVATYAGIKTLIDKTPEEAAQIVLKELRNHAEEIAASNKVLSDKLRDSVEQVAIELDRAKREIIREGTGSRIVEVEITSHPESKRPPATDVDEANNINDNLIEKAISKFYESDYVGAWIFFSKFLPYGDRLRETSPRIAYLEAKLSKQLDIARQHPTNLSNQAELSHTLFELCRHNHIDMTLRGRNQWVFEPISAADSSVLSGIVGLEIEGAAPVEPFSEALKEDEREVGKGHQRVGCDLYLIGKALAKSGDENESAHEYFRKALNIYASVFGNRHVLVAGILSSIGWLLIESKTEESINVFSSAAEINLMNFGERHPIVAKNWKDIGLSLMLLGAKHQSLLYYKAALNSDVSNFGMGHISVAMTKSQIGSIYNGLDIYGEAVPYLKDAYPILLKHYGHDSPLVTLTKEHLDLAISQKASHK